MLAHPLKFDKISAVVAPTSLVGMTVFLGLNPRSRRLQTRKSELLMKSVCQMKNLLATCMAFSVLSLTLSVSAATTIHTIGDSTVAIWPSNFYPKTGWGQDLHFFFDSSKVVIDDQAISGTSAKSFYDNNWTAVKTTIKAGDFVTIQFGINDAASDAARHTDPFTTFEDYLTRFCNETMALGAHPILVATVNRNTWKNGVIYPAYHNYPIATRQLAAKIAVPLIDLDKMEGDLRTSVGESYSLNYLSMIFPAGDWPNYLTGSSDSVHFQESGAIELDNLVIAGIKLLQADPNVSQLIPALLPTNPVTIRINQFTFGIVTRTQNVPAGITFTFLAVPNAGHTFIGWSGDVTTTNALTQFTMGTTAKLITGNFQ